MDAFRDAMAIVMRHEGGYSMDPDDPGGETYRGISRRHHPSWPGWEIIDVERGAPAFPESLEDLEELQAKVAAFYRVHYWDRLSGDELAMLAPSLASRLFDMAVNLGVHRAAIMLQQALNALNRNGTSWPDLAEDGVIGPITIGAVKVCVSVPNDSATLLSALRIIQGQHYLETMRRHPTLEKYARGWLARAMI